MASLLKFFIRTCCIAAICLAYRAELLSAAQLDVSAAQTFERDSATIAGTFFFGGASACETADHPSLVSSPFVECLRLSLLEGNEKTAGAPINFLDTRAENNEDGDNATGGSATDKNATDKVAQSVPAEEDDWKGLFTPYDPKAWKIYTAAGIAVSVLPRNVIYGEVTRQFPQVSFLARMGLPLNFGLRFALNTVYIANIARLGLAWSFNIGPVALSVGDDFGLWFGIAELSGFDVKGLGALNFPHISAGINIENFLLTLKAEGITSLGSKTWLGTAENPVLEKGSLLGAALTTVVETNVAKNLRGYFGIRTSYTLPRLQMWLTFSEISYRVAIPEFLIGIIF